MLATYGSALIILVGALAVGRALTHALGSRETTWLEPVVGFALLSLVGSFSIRVLDSGTASAVLLAVLILAALIYLRGRLLPIEDLRIAAAPAGLAALFASLPIIASERIGILGIGINNDLAQHLLWSEWLREQVDQIPISLSNGYPIGPHSLVASLGETIGAEMTEGFVGMLVALAVLSALASLALLRELRPLRRLVGATLVALPYLTASALAVGGFKEMTMGLMLLGWVLGLARLERTFPDDRPTLVSLAVIAAGTVSIYSYPGLYWLIASAGLVVLLAAARAFWADRLGEELRRAARLLAVPALVFVVLVASEAGRALTFYDHSGVDIVIESDSKLRQAVSPLEALGPWPDNDFLAGTSGPPAYLLFGLLGLLALALAVRWWLRRGEPALPLGVLGAFFVYLGTLAQGGLYVQTKALAVPAPLVMLLILRALLAPEDEPEAAADDERGRRPAPTASPWGLARVALAVAFVAIAAFSSFLALRDAVVAPNEHADELALLRGQIDDDAWTLSLTTDRYTDYHLRTTMVGSPARNAQLIVPSRNGKDFRLPLDFDSVAPETLDQFEWVLVTGAPYRSQPPPNLELVDATDTYELWRRTGPSRLNQRVFGEEARPGKVLNCRAIDIKIGNKRRAAETATIIQPPPVIGKRFSWEPDGKLGAGESSTQTLRLPPGEWELSMQYQSPVVGLEVSGADESFDVPPAMDGAIPFRFGEGPFWPVGQITSAGGPVEIEVRADDLSGFQDLIGLSRQAAIGNIVATQADPYTEISFADACGDYVDHYTIPLSEVDPGPSLERRKLAEFALTGHYIPRGEDGGSRQQEGGGK